MQCITALYIEQTILPLRNYDIGLLEIRRALLFPKLSSFYARTGGGVHFRFLSFFFFFRPYRSIGYALKMSKRIGFFLSLFLFIPEPSDFAAGNLGKLGGEEAGRHLDARHVAVSDAFISLCRFE